MSAPNKKQVKKIQRHKNKLRSSLWPEIKDNSLWHYNIETGGFLNIPRSMPLILRIMDNLSKGKPVSLVYFDIWCRAYNDNFVIASKPKEMAFYSGFNGERAERTWSDRIHILTSLGFIKVKDGSHGSISYILILNPFQVIKGYMEKGSIDGRFSNALLERLIETGTDELEDSKSVEVIIAKQEESTEQNVKNTGDIGDIMEAAKLAPTFERDGILT